MYSTWGAFGLRALNEFDLKGPSAGGRPVPAKRPSASAEADAGCV